MTVQEMISLLKKYSPDLRVEFENQDGDIIEDFTTQEAYGVVVIKEF